LIALGQAIREGRLRDVRGVPTSLRSQHRAHELQIPLVSLQEARSIDVTVDGADEVDPDLNLIKGLGGALLREKIVAQNSKRVVIIVDSSKLVEELGTRSPLPVEVAVFGHETHEPYLQSLQSRPVLRRNSDGTLFDTDNGNHVYDCRFERIDLPAVLETALRKRAGIIESGLFLGIAKLAIIAHEDRVELRER